MDGTIEMDTAASVVCGEPDIGAAQELAEMDRILGLVVAELNRRFGAQKAISRNGPPLDGEHLLLEEHRAALIVCCGSLRQQHSIDTELILGLELMVGDLSRDQLKVFLANLPITPLPARARRGTRLSVVQPGARHCARRAAAPTQSR